MTPQEFQSMASSANAGGAAGPQSSTQQAGAATQRAPSSWDGQFSRLASSLAQLAEVQRREAQQQQQQGQGHPTLQLQMEGGQQYLLQHPHQHQQLPLETHSFDNAAHTNLMEAQLLHQLAFAGDSAASALRMHSAPQHQLSGLESAEWAQISPHLQQLPLGTAMQSNSGTSQPLQYVPHVRTQLHSVAAHALQPLHVIDGRAVGGIGMPTSASARMPGGWSQLAGSGASTAADNSLANLQAARMSLQGTGHTPALHVMAVDDPRQGNSTVALQPWLPDRRAGSSQQLQQQPQQQLPVQAHAQLRQATGSVGMLHLGSSGIMSSAPAISFVSMPSQHSLSGGLPATSLSGPSFAVQQLPSSGLLQDTSAGRLPQLHHVAVAPGMAVPPNVYFQASASESGLQSMQAVTLSSGSLLPARQPSSGVPTRGPLVANAAGSCSGSKRSGASRRRKAKMYQALNAIVQAVVEEGVDRDSAEAAAAAAAATLKGGVPNLPGGSAACASVVQAVFQQWLHQQLALKKLQASMASTPGQQLKPPQAPAPAGGASGVLTAQQASELARLELASASAPAHSLLFSGALERGAGTEFDTGVGSLLAGSADAAAQHTQQLAELLEQLLRADSQGGRSSAGTALSFLQAAESSNSEDGDEILDSEDLQLLSHLNLKSLDPQPAQAKPARGSASSHGTSSGATPAATAGAAAAAAAGPVSRRLPQSSPHLRRSSNAGREGLVGSLAPTSGPLCDALSSSGSLLPSPGIGMSVSGASQAGTRDLSGELLRTGPVPLEAQLCSGSLPSCSTQAFVSQEPAGSASSLPWSRGVTSTSTLGVEASPLSSPNRLVSEMIARGQAGEQLDLLLQALNSQQGPHAN